jgi:hypothetical protein
VALNAELQRIAEASAGFADPEEELSGIVPAEPGGGERIYLCAFRNGAGETSWLALDERARPVGRRTVLRDAISIVALCELAEETAAGGDLADLRSQLVALRLTEDPPGIDEAEAALSELEAVLAPPPRLASPAYLDEVGAATRRLEQALGEMHASPFAEAMKQAVPTVEALTRDIEAHYKHQLA